MRFDLSDDQREIKRTAHELLASRSSMERVRQAAERGTYDDALWAQVRELGWPGIAIAEEHGGQGLGTVELAVLLEELGYACAASPLLSTTLAALVIEHSGSDAQRERWLPALAAGEATGALGTSIDGVAELLPDADAAAVIVLVEDGAARLLSPGDAEVTPVETIDPTRRYGRVTAGLAAGEPLEGDVAAGLDRAAVAVAAELVGVSQRALDMTVAYVKERRQFGVPVGAFQAVGHTAAQMLRDTEGARSATLYAAWTADADAEALPLAAAMAKAAASDAGRSTTASAIQLHGGIGFTWEADVHWLYKRAQLDAAYLGGPAVHRGRIAALLASQPAAAVAR
jgi:alkylation response protein AidB-like acyl-CoA dehydrogenase